MKRILTTSIMALIMGLCDAQTNIFPTDGNVGIGTLSPDNQQGWNKVLELKGDQDAKLLVTTFGGIKLGMFSHIGYNAKIGTESNTNLTFTAGYWNDVMTLTTAGNVGIGTLTPQDRFSVNGSIRARGVKVENANWPDYVFTPTYELMSLPKVETFIKNNGHLPDIPSAAEVARKGIDLGENQALLLRKIEELPLHLIEMDKKVIKLEEENLEFKEKLRSIDTLSKYGKSHYQNTPK